MALVVIGTLVALLRTIASNTESDPGSVNRFRSGRINAYELSLRWLSFGALNRTCVHVLSQ